MEPRILIYSWHTNDSSGISFRNGGLGPAIVRYFTVTLDSQPVTRWTEALRPILPVIGDNWQFTQFGPGMTIKVDAEGPLLVTQGAARARSLDSLVENHLDVALCYCSLYDDCWLETLSEATPKLRRPACPDAEHDVTPGS